MKFILIRIALSDFVATISTAKLVIVLSVTMMVKSITVLLVVTLNTETL